MQPDALGPFERLWLRVGGYESLVSIIGGAVIVAICLGFFLFATATDPDTWVPALVCVMVLVISLPIAHFFAGRPLDNRLFKILLLSLLLKTAAVGPRYVMLEVYYGGEGDAKRYDQAGDMLLENMTKGEFSIEGTELDAFPRETRVVGYLTGLLYLAFGSSYLGAFFVFSWVAWLGMLCALRAFQVAYPNAPPYRAAMLILFLPSMVFWPSLPGKDSIMVLLLGLVALGAARVLTGRKVAWGIAWLALGGVLMAQIRPHLLLMAAAALAGSQFARPEGSPGAKGIAVRLVLLAVLVPVLVNGVSRLDEFTGSSGEESESLASSLDSTIARTEIGGSAFTPTPVRTPIDIPAATITVLYRPFVFEARNPVVLVSAMEGMLLLVLTALALRWIWRVFPAMYRSPFAAFCGVFILGYVVAFSNIANAGILSRQRTQLYPMLMLLVAIAYEIHRLALDDRPVEQELAVARERRRAASRLLTPPVPA